jgi:ABC-type multidrug transport system fused ATPase/permease subunit
MSGKLNEASITYRGLLVNYLKPQFRRALLMSALLLGGIALQLINPQLLRYFIDTATSAHANTQALLGVGIVFIALALLNQGITVYSTYLSENIAWTATNRLRTDLVAHCLRLEIAFHKAHTSGEMIERAVGKLLAGRTGIIIAHRLATIQRTDEILVLEDGRVLEYDARTSLANDQDSRFYRLLHTGLEEVIA